MGKPLLVIQDHTERADRHWLLALVWPAVGLMNQAPLSRIPSLKAGTHYRYLLGRLHSHTVQHGLTLRGPNLLADSVAVANYGRSGSRWEELFPQSKGYFVLSAVGFNADQTQALLYVDHFCGLCGHGGFVLLGKVDGRWAVEAEADTWISQERRPAGRPDPHSVLQKSPANLHVQAVKVGGIRPT